MSAGPGSSRPGAATLTAPGAIANQVPAAPENHTHFSRFEAAGPGLAYGVPELVSAWQPMSDVNDFG
jgi:hypothetical protein